jgi:UDP-2,3-diacylglucosamine pyrophosphatase LpxH
MSDKPVTLVVSDLHVGGGAQDPGDDHVYQNDQFRRFVEETANSDDGRAGRVELFINGDFLEFAQVRPDIYTLGSADYWCSEAESVEKLRAILGGHADIFAALKAFGDRGNQVTLGAGNHDVDLYWGDVQKMIGEAAGGVRFETGQDVSTRHGGRLVIGHGHMIDPANSFKNWADPFVVRKGRGGADELRLEMCPGTLFMVKFVNGLEDRYKFSDNMKPITALARLLYKEQRWGLAVAAWSFLSFVARHPTVALSADDQKLVGMTSVGSRVAEELAVNPEFLARVGDAYRELVDASAGDAEVAAALGTEEAVNAFVNRLIVEGFGPDRFVQLFNVSAGGTLGVGGGGEHLSIIRAGMAHDKEELRQEAERRLAEPGVEVVVFGHTHQPDEWRGLGGGTEGGYFNPGSWTRYVDVTDMADLKLDDLKREEDFPYQLNYVRVEEGASGSLRAEMKCFEEQSGDRFRPRH